jgi:Bacterial Ig-like domain (group 2)
VRLPIRLFKTLVNGLAVATLISVLISCGGNSYSGGGGKTLQSIKVTPANATIAKGLTQQFTATATFSDGSTQDGRLRSLPAGDEFGLEQRLSVHDQQQHRCSHPG